MDRERRAFTVSVISLVIAAVVALVGPVWDLGQALYSFANDVHVEITKPNGANPEVGRCIRVAGSARNVPPDQDLWLVLRPATDRKFYPQNRGVVIPDHDGKWSVEGVALGAPSQHNREGEYFTFAVYLATSAQSSEFTNYIEKADELGNPGMESINDGLRRVAEREAKRVEGVPSEC